VTNLTKGVTRTGFGWLNKGSLKANANGTFEPALLCAPDKTGQKYGRGGAKKGKTVFWSCGGGEMTAEPEELEKGDRREREEKKDARNWIQG